MSAILETMRDALGAAQQQRDNAKSDYRMATKVYEEAEAEFAKLQAAVAALNGEATPEVTTEAISGEYVELTHAGAEAEEETPEGFVKGPEGELIDCRALPPPPNDMKPINDPNNPYAAMKCAGCGRYGGISQRGIVRKGKQMIVTMCSCGNEIY